VAGGKIARVAESIAPPEARRLADVKGLYVTPGWWTSTFHVYAGTGIAGVHLRVGKEGPTFVEAIILAPRIVH
jgi:predicted amidohydrolase